MAEEGESIPTGEETTIEKIEDKKVEKIERPRPTHLLQWMEITVSEPEKRTVASMKMQDTFIAYLVETRVTDPHMRGYGEGATSVWRRYSEFELLRNYLDATFPAVVVPPLPEKKASYTWQNASTDKFDPDFVERRRAALEIFLLRVAAHPKLCQDKMFTGFLKEENGWKEAVYSTDFQSKAFLLQAESRLKSLNAAFRLKKPDRRFEELKNYSNELQNNIADILKIRVRLSDKMYGIHKVHANYARVFHEWSLIEKDISQPLQSAGHYMDVYASSVDVALEEEEQYADQLKEYYAFGDSLRSVCRRYECAEYDLERAEDNLSSKTSQRELLATGKSGNSFSLSGMKSKLFGGDTPEQRDLKLKQLDQQIVEAEQDLKSTTQEAHVIIEAALRDIDRFKRQKVKDLREIFTNYAVMQIKQCKKGIAIWTSAKDCFTKM